MATNQTGIAITIKAWLPTGKTLDEQLASLTIVKTAHETGDYAPLLAAAQIEAVQTDSKTRRVGETPAATEVPAPIPAAAEPAATDDALAERPSLTEEDGTVTEPAVTEDEHPMTTALKADRKKKAA